MCLFVFFFFLTETRIVQVTPRVAILMTREWATKRPKSQRKLKVSGVTVKNLGSFSLYLATSYRMWK